MKKIPYSLLQSEKECYLCHKPNVVKHHIYKGDYAREQSDKYGMWVWLCPMHHNINYGVHNDTKFDKFLMRTGQELFEKYYEPNGRAFFMSVFRKNYLEGEEDEEINTCNVD